MNKARYGKDGKLKSSLVTKAAEAAFERYEEAWFNFHRYDKDGNGVIDVKELISLLSDMKMHVGRANRSEEQMALFVSREIKKNDLNGDGVLNFEEFLTYYNKFVARHRSQCDEIYEVVEGKELGRGAFGVVVLGRRLENGQEVAMKRLVKAEVSQSESALELLHNEIAVWESLSHPNLLTLLDVFEEPECLILVTEMMRGGDLFQRLRSTPESRFAEAVAARLSYQVLAAVAYLHSNNIVHCDLKPNNVLIAEAVGDPPFLASDEQILFYKILETTPDMPSNVSPLAAELILALMRKEPEERLTCAPAMKYRWLEAGWS